MCLSVVLEIPHIDSNIAMNTHPTEATYSVPNCIRDTNGCIHVDSGILTTLESVLS